MNIDDSTPPAGSQPSDSLEGDRVLREALEHWEAPRPAAGFAARVIAEWEASDKGRVCVAFRSRLEEWRSGDLSAANAALCAEHAASCEACAEEVRDAAAVERLLRAHRAPPVPGGLADRILARVAPATGRTRPRAVARTALLAAAALLAAIVSLFVSSSTDRAARDERVPQLVRTESPRAISPFDRIEADRERRLRTVLHSVRPDATGSFAAKSTRIDSLSRPGGNLFHVALRRAKSETTTASPSDRSR